ncbi:uncharacterized protein LOC135483651 [Lineus longissimus]|uniref:uncharacterized protein LOC135483651 n=1 Tax=Lineus longissimus TaxID=88925 RepID=UPI002B4F665A
MVAISEVKSMFWGVTLDGGKRYSQLVENSFHISMAALEPPKKKDVPKEERFVSVMLQHEKTEFLLCTLEVGKLHQQPLDLNFTEGEEVIFFLNGGKGVVHLTGYLVGDDRYDNDLPEGMFASEEEMSTDEEASDDEEDSDDEDVPILQAIEDDTDTSDEDDEDFIPSKDGKRKKRVPEKASKKIRVEKMQMDDDDDEDDSEEDDYDWLDDGAKDFLGYEEGDSDDDDDDDDSDEDSDGNYEERLQTLVSALEMKTPKSEKKGKPETPKSSKKNAKQEQQKSAKKEKPQETPKSVKKENAQTPKSAKKPNSAETPKSVKKENASAATPSQAANNTPETPKSKKKKKRKKNKDGETSQPQTPQQNQTPQKNQQQNQQKTPGNQTPQQPKKPVKKTIQGGIALEITKEGHGPEAKHGKTVTVNYTGRLTNGKVFDSNRGGPGFKFKLGKNEVIKGWDLALQGMKVGGKRKITIPPAMAYGKEKLDGIPANSTLVFDVELNKVS